MNQPVARDVTRGRLVSSHSGSKSRRVMVVTSAAVIVTALALASSIWSLSQYRADLSYSAQADFAAARADDLYQTELDRIAALQATLDQIQVGPVSGGLTDVQIDAIARQIGAKNAVRQAQIDAAPAKERADTTSRIAADAREQVQISLNRFVWLCVGSGFLAMLSVAAIAVVRRSERPDLRQVGKLAS